VGWEGQAAGADRTARRERLFFRSQKQRSTVRRADVVYLVELDGNETDEQSVNPGAFSADPNLICPTQRKVASSARG